MKPTKKTMCKRNNMQCQYNVEAQVFNGETCAYECFKVHQSPHYVGKNTGGDGYDAPILYKTIIFAHITHFCVQI